MTKPSSVKAEAIILPHLEHLEQLETAESPEGGLPLAISIIGQEGKNLAAATWEYTRPILSRQLDTYHQAVRAIGTINWKTVGIGALIGGVALCILFGSLSALVFILGAALGATAAWGLTRLTHWWQSKSIEERSVYLKDVITKVDNLFSVSPQ